MNVQRFLRLSIIFAFCAILTTGWGNSAEINGYPIAKEDSAALDTFLLQHQWEILPTDTVQRGTINSFAAKDQQLCAIALGDIIFVYKNGIVDSCYHYYTPGSYRLLFDDANLIIYEVRGSKLLLVNLNNGELSLYNLEAESADYELQSKFYKFGKTHKDAIVGGYGYRVASHFPALGEIFGEYEYLVFKQNGQDIVLYETYAQTILFAFNVLIVLVAGITLFYILRKKRTKA